MSTTEESFNTHVGQDEHGHPVPPTVDELQAMTPEQRMIAAAELDDIHIVHRRERFPVRGTKAEKRSERAVAACFAISGAAGIAFIVCFVAVPYTWHLPGTPQSFRFYTPLLGGLLATLLLFMGVGLVLWAKWLMPEEEVIQERHDTPTPPEEIIMTEATLQIGLEDTGLPRRSLILRTLGLAGGALAAVPIVALVGGMIKKPHGLFQTFFKTDQKLFPQYQGRVPLVYQDFRQVSPDDFEPGAIATVFPGVRQNDADGDNGLTSASSPTVVIRLRPGQTVKARKGQANYGWPPENPQYVAFSKICTHAGCPASLYQKQDARLLCPCHQSQFDVLLDAKPVFGPAARSLPKLPLDVVTGEDNRQYFVARHDFPEAVGPGFWERP